MPLELKFLTARVSWEASRKKRKESLPGETCSGIVWDNFEKKSFVEGPLLLMMTWCLNINKTN